MEIPTIAELRSRVESLPPEDKERALNLLTELDIDLSKRNDNLTGTGVSGFIFENRFYKAESHKEIFLKVAEIILKKYPNERGKIFSVKGRKKVYFSRNFTDFRHNYELISGTDIYADINENAAQLNRRCQKILQVYGISPSSLTVIPSSY
ncbi:MAG: hypothetical protein JRI48_00885 [Deltaproteobacteria bacterium]|nr:hypothetical protein [Deltaproteobacteria bacterium]